MQRIRSCYQGNEATIKYFIEKDIRYIVQNERITQTFSLPEKFGKKVFDNNSVTVWKLDV